jgi:hypothetical protein
MEEEAGIKEVINGHEDKNSKEEIFTRVVRAGKRTYFFDVKATRKDDYYLTITESKKRLGKEGKVFYEKHKIFLYKEDFDKFSTGLSETIEFIKTGKMPPPQPAEEKEEPAADEEIMNKHQSIEFEDLTSDTESN